MKEPNLLKEAGQDFFTGFVRSATTGRSAQQKSLQTKTSPADVVRMMLLFLRFHVVQIVLRYHGAGARTRRQVQMLLKLVPLPKVP